MVYEGLKWALEALASGSPIMLYDDDRREGEVDLVYPAWAVDSEVIYDLRVSAGGLICYATDRKVVEFLGLPWGDELLAGYGRLGLLASKRLKYGDKPAFTIWVNHINVKTGISDEDRSLTLRSLDDVVRLYYEGKPEKALEKFYSEFQAPGHVPILAARSLRERRGHTELAIALLKAAGLRPSAVFAEVLSKGRSATLEEARGIAARRKMPLVTGRDILEWCSRVEMCWDS
ncbi:MAG: 3,4-dihydroxy-2-butanone-4-phosphate synthase [Acidilobaceae archaeon]